MQDYHVRLPPGDLNRVAVLPRALLLLTCLRRIFDTFPRLGTTTRAIPNKSTSGDGLVLVVS